MMLAVGLTPWVLMLMALFGTLMSGGSIQGASTIYSYAMVVVGALMAINGAMMFRTPMPI